ncbi:hypothetical protein HDV00_006450 [Rhizophlyctis rosea]|nr:hypothetical protein HDV00_006450 [Rhizophlyctis rosea]
MRYTLHKGVMIATLIALAYTSFVCFGYDLTTPVTTTWRLQFMLSLLVPMTGVAILDFLMQSTQWMLVTKLKGDLERRGAKLRREGAWRRVSRVMTGGVMSGEGAGKEDSRRDHTKTTTDDNNIHHHHNRNNNDALASNNRDSIAAHAAITHSSRFILSLILVEAFSAVIGLTIYPVLTSSKYCLLGDILGPVLIKTYHIANLWYNQAIPKFVQDCVEEVGGGRSLGSEVLESCEEEGGELASGSDVEGASGSEDVGGRKKRSWDMLVRDSVASRMNHSTGTHSKGSIH